MNREFWLNYIDNISSNNKPIVTNDQGAFRVQQSANVFHSSFLFVCCVYVCVCVFFFVWLLCFLLIKRCAKEILRNLFKCIGALNHNFLQYFYIATNNIANSAHKLCTHTHTNILMIDILYFLFYFFGISYTIHHHKINVLKITNDRQQEVTCRYLIPLIELNKNIVCS